MSLSSFEGRCEAVVDGRRLKKGDFRRRRSPSFRHPRSSNLALFLMDRCLELDSNIGFKIEATFTNKTDVENYFHVAIDCFRYSQPKLTRKNLAGMQPASCGKNNNEPKVSSSKQGSHHRQSTAEEKTSQKSPSSALTK